MRLLIENSGRWEKHRSTGLAAELRQLNQLRRLGEHRSPGVQEAPDPTRISFVRNTETPSRSRHPTRVKGRPIARKAESLGGNRKAQEANAGSRKATGNQDDKPCLPGGPA